jgi:uncharacterized membrane protein YbhN (UPF0104 family)
MRDRWRRFWPFVKLLLTLAILFFVGKNLARDLADPQLWQRSFHPGWMVACALLSAELYLLGLGFAVLYWGLLLKQFGQHPTPMGLARGYYIGMLGKYVPGKAWALLMRASFVRNPAVRVSVAVQTAFYEVLMTMAAGAVLATILFPLTGPDGPEGMNWPAFVDLVHPAPDHESAVDRGLATLFAAALALPLLAAGLPPVFNRAVERLSLPFRKADSSPLPQLNIAQYLKGIALLLPCWLCLGASFWIMLNAALPQPLEWTWAGFGYITAVTATAYVAGFVILIAPSGLGVREFILLLFLRPEFGGPSAALAVLVIRLVWTAAELILAGGLYVLTPGGGALRVEQPV